LRTIKPFSTLKYVRLNQWSDYSLNDVNDVMTALSDLTSLQELYCPVPQEQPGAFALVSKFLRRTTSLKKLNLRFDYTTRPEYAIFYKALRQNTTLEELHVGPGPHYFLDIHQRLIYAIAEALQPGTRSRLKKLSIERPMITETSFVVLLQSLTAYKKLESLTISIMDAWYMDAFATLLRVPTALKELTILGPFCEDVFEEKHAQDWSNEVLPPLMEFMRNDNNTIKTFQVIGFYLNKASLKAVADLVRADSCLESFDLHNTMLEPGLSLQPVLEALEEKKKRHQGYARTPRFQWTLTERERDL
jgi:hypothetical protein